MGGHAPQIVLAANDSDIARCFPVIAALRPHLLADDFVARVQRQQAQGYRLAYLSEKEAVQSVAGFRIAEGLAWGKHLYVDDLVTHTDARSRGYGAQLFQWLIAYARTQECERVELDSGVQRFAAHRFYFAQRMEISSHHFSLKL